MRLLHAARLSQRARGHEQTGIESSDREAQQWAEANGHVIVATVADTKSGTTAMWARPNLKPWVTEPDRLAEYDGIVAYKSDRLSRAAWADEIQIRLWAQQHGKELFIVSPALHWPPANQAEQLSWEIFASQAHEEWKNTSERYRRMQGYLRSEGKLVGRAPFGYEVVPAEDGHKTLAPTEAGRKFVPEIFRRCIAGDSLATIALWLDAEGAPLPSANSTTWQPRTVGTIIRCTTMMGRRTDATGKTILKCEPLVDPVTFRRAGEALDARPKRGPMNNDGKAMLTSVLHCPKCSGPMYRVYTGRGASRKPYYRCAGKGAVRKSACRNMVPVEVVDAIVNEYMATNDDPVMVTRIKPGRDYSEELEAIKLEIRELALRDLDDAGYDAELVRLRAERDHYASLPTRLDELVSEPTGETYAERWARLSTAERGAWLRSSGARVTAIRLTLSNAMASMDHDHGYAMGRNGVLVRITTVR